MKSGQLSSRKPLPFIKDLARDCWSLFYEIVLMHRLRKNGLEVAKQVSIPIEYEGVKFDEGF